MRHGAGYIAVYLPSHPNAMKAHRNYVYQHRAVAADMLGRPLRKDEIVHHINGKKDDNRPENLQVMTQSEHVRLHSKKTRT